MEDITRRVDTAYTQITRIADKRARRDLVLMMRTIDRKVTELDQASVECRRLHKVTPKYTELEQECQGLLTNIEQHITFASLLG
jgi:replicative DNA helicase